MEKALEHEPDDDNGDVVSRTKVRVRIPAEFEVDELNWDGLKNMDTIDKEELLFYIDKGTMQDWAMRTIGRSMTEEELDIAKDGFEWGLMTDIETVYKTILLEMLKDKNRYNISLV